MIKYIYLVVFAICSSITAKAQTGTGNVNAMEKAAQERNERNEKHAKEDKEKNKETNAGSNNDNNNNSAFVGTLL